MDNKRACYHDNFAAAQRTASETMVIVVISLNYAAQIELR